MFPSVVKLLFITMNDTLVGLINLIISLIIVISVGFFFLPVSCLFHGGGLPLVLFFGGYFLILLNPDLNNFRSFTFSFYYNVIKLWLMPVISTFLLMLIFVQLMKLGEHQFSGGCGQKVYCFG